MSNKLIKQLAGMTSMFTMVFFTITWFIGGAVGLCYHETWINEARFIITCFLASLVLGYIVALIADWDDYKKITE